MTSSYTTILLAVVCGLIGVTLGGYTRSVTPGQSNGHSYEVFASGLGKVDNIVVAPQNTLYVTLEKQGGKGSVVRLKRGRRDTLMNGLDRPDGLMLSDGKLYVTEESDDGRVLAFDLKSRDTTVVARLSRPEGIRRRYDGSLFVTEDRAVDGRLVIVGKDSRITPIVRGLKKPEGLDVASDGSVYLAESGTGRVLRVARSGIETVLTGLEQPDQVAIAPDGAIWITEDSNPGRALRYLDGKLEVVLAGLNKPQGIALGSDGWVYIAEQGRDRIVRLRPRT